MESEFEHDVIILGAGPGGTSTAIQLATFGLKVAIIERLQFPRAHVGICISDQTLSLFDYLGLDDELRNAKFWRRNEIAVKWGTSKINLVEQKGLHVDRGALDQHMLCKAKDAGVIVYQPARVLYSQRLGDSGWRITVSNDGQCQELRGRFIVDASGRKSAFPGPLIDDSPPLIALHANWSLKNPLKFDGLIESGEEAWLWYAQTAPHQAVLSVFCDPRYLRSKKQSDLQSSYVHLLKQFETLQTYHFGKQCSDSLGCDATSRHAGDPVSDQHIRVGDACVSVDPLSSQGVHLAILSGLQAAVVVNTILMMPENGKLAKQFFQMRIADRVSQYSNKTKNEYARVSAVRAESFWHERSKNRVAIETPANLPSLEHIPPAPRTQVSISTDVNIEKAPVIDGMFVKERQVLKHPNIDGAIAFLDGVNLIPLLSALPQELSYDDIPIYWQEQIPPATGSKIVSWLWDKQILVEVY